MFKKAVILLIIPIMIALVTIPVYAYSSEISVKAKYSEDFPKDMYVSDFVDETACIVTKTNVIVSVSNTGIDSGKFIVSEISTAEESYKWIKKLFSDKILTSILYINYQDSFTNTLELSSESKLSIELPDARTKNSIIYYVSADGTITKVNSEYTENTILCHTDKQGFFVIEKEIANETNSSPSTEITETKTQNTASPSEYVATADENITKFSGELNSIQTGDSMQIIILYSIFIVMVLFIIVVAVLTKLSLNKK